LNARNIDNTKFIDPTPLFCTTNNTDEKYQAGPNITCVMREVKNLPLDIISYIIKK